VEVFEEPFQIRRKVKMEIWADGLKEMFGACVGEPDAMK